MSAIRNKFFLVAALAALPRAEAASFSITSGTNTSAQTLSGTSQTGSVSSGATLTGSSTNIPVTISGNSATLTNLGTISQTGTGRAVFVSSNVTGLVINNGSASNSTALIQAADADVLRGDKANVNVTLYNYGTLNSLNPSKGGSQAVDFNPITTGTNVINNYSTGQLLASDADAVRPGVNGTINNSGTIKATTTSTTGNSSDGIDGQNNLGFTVNNSGSGLIQGQSESAIFVDGPASGHTVSITNLAGGTIQGGGTSSAAILTGADNDTLTNSGTINGTSSGVAVNLGAGNNTMSITGGSASILGDVNGGVGGTNLLSIAPGTGNNFAYSNVLSNFSAVEILSGMVTLSGVNTYTGTTKVSGGTLKLSGANRVSSSSSLQLNGGTLETANAGGANGQSFSSLGLSDNSTLDLDASSLTFSGLGTITAGKTLAIIDYSGGVSPGYAIRIAGNLTSDATFRSLLGRTTINGNGAVATFDGTYTDVMADVMAAPEPSTIALGCLGLLVLPVIRKRAVRQ